MKTQRKTKTRQKQKQKNLEAFRDRHLAPPQAKTKVVQVKLTLIEDRAFDGLVEWMREHGAPTASRSSVARALIVDALDVWNDQLREDAG